MKWVLIIALFHHSTPVSTGDVYTVEVPMPSEAACTEALNNTQVKRKSHNVDDRGVDWLDVICERRD